MNKSIFVDNKCINLKKTLNKCMKYDLISFDVFDTLIKRNLGQPKDLFVILDKIANDLNISGFMEMRIKSETELRKKEQFITLTEIYNYLKKYIGEEKASLIKEQEIDLELKYCQSNFEVKKLYDILKKNGKRIVATSDMYLPSDIISKMLKKCEINVDKIYVSCECKAKKTDGSLFKYLINNEKISKKNIIHIGDNWKADFLGARKIGINSLHVKKDFVKYNKKRFSKSIKEKDKYNVYYRIINNNLDMQNSFYMKYGFAILGPLVYNYSIWLDKMCEQEKIKKIFFFARDGFVLKKAFDLLYGKKYDTSYVYFSRRAIRIPYSAINPSYENIMKYFPKTKILTMQVYFENFGLNPIEYIDLIEKYNFKLDSNIYYKDLFTNPIFKEIFNIIYPNIKKEAEKEYNILKKYICQEKIFGNIGIVDIGWHNSMQYYLNEIAIHNNYKLNMFGFYVGKMHGEKPVSFSKGFISDIDDSGYADSALSFIGLIESVFLALEGSTKTYVEELNGKIVPHLLDYEYNDEDIEYKALSEIQMGIDNFIELISKLKYFDVFSLSGEDSYLAMKSFGINPYLHDIKYFSKFRYFSEEFVYFSNAKSILFYFLHLKQFKVDFYKSRWKIGFMKEILKIKLPYYNIYKKLRR